MGGSQVWASEMVTRHAYHLNSSRIQRKVIRLKHTPSVDVCASACEVILGATATLNRHLHSPLKHHRQDWYWLMGQLLPLFLHVLETPMWRGVDDVTGLPVFRAHCQFHHNMGIWRYVYLPVNGIACTQPIRIIYITKLGNLKALQKSKTSGITTAIAA